MMCRSVILFFTSTEVLQGACSSNTINIPVQIINVDICSFYIVLCIGLNRKYFTLYFMCIFVKPLSHCISGQVPTGTTFHQDNSPATRTTPHQENSLLITCRATPHQDNSLLITCRTTPHQENSLLITCRTTPHQENSLLITCRTTPHQENSLLITCRTTPY